MNRGKCRRKFSRSALFLVLSAGLCRGGRGLGAAAGTPLMKILGHRGHNDRKDGQNHDDLQIRQLVIGIEQGLQNVAHRTVPFRSRRNRSEEVGSQPDAAVLVRLHGGRDDSIHDGHGCREAGPEGGQIQHPQNRALGVELVRPKGPQNAKAEILFPVHLMALAVFLPIEVMFDGIPDKTVVGVFCPLGIFHCCTSVFVS